MTVLLYYVYILPLLVGCLSSLKAFRLDWPRPFRWFSVFLFLTLFIELFALAWKYELFSTRWWHYSRNNLWIYNIYLIPQYFFYIYFFSRTTEVIWIRKNGPYIAWAYAIGATLNLVFGQGPDLVNYFTILVANFIVFLFSMAYFVHLMRDKVVVRLSKEPMVWISIGAFVFHLGSLPCFILLNYISFENIVLALSLFRIIIILNTLMYLSYSIAFLCTRRYPMSLS